MRIAILLILISVFSFSACSSRPTVRFEKITSANQLTGEELGTFALQKSVITIEKRKDKDGEKLEISAGPKEFLDYTVAVYDASNFGVETNLNVSKFPNTDVVKEVGFEVVDHRVEYINAVGGIVGTALDIVLAADGGTFPREIDVNTILENHLEENPTKKRAEALGPINIIGGKIWFDKIPPDAIKAKDYPFSSSKNSFLYAACRNATVTAELGGKTLRKTVKVSDPFFYQQVAFPNKGKITKHSGCGASVVSEKSGIPSEFAIIQALATQGKAIKDAIDSAKKKEANPQ